MGYLNKSDKYAQLWQVVQGFSVYCYILHSTMKSMRKCVMPSKIKFGRQCIIVQNKVKITQFICFCLCPCLWADPFAVCFLASICPSRTLTQPLGEPRLLEHSLIRCLEFWVSFS